MVQISLDETQIKALFKQAVLEVLEEQKDALSDLLLEVIEDAGLVNAIQEGASSEVVSRDEIFEMLEKVS
jgi:hypothetical protein